MKREKITISENGIITLPGNPVETVWMRDFEIAELGDKVIIPGFTDLHAYGQF
jgi:cytosine/adenosine deaminase-related metal-dependent hydrolase